MLRVLMILLPLLAAGIGRANADGIFTLEERDLDNRSHAVDRGLDIVDINSTILLRVDIGHGILLW